jgi:hypothetical protein
MTEKTFDDIANALMRLRAAFKRHGLECPVALELKTRRDGDHLRHMVGRDMTYSQPQMGRGQNPDIVINLVGFEIRYPAEFRARERGGFDIL